MRTFIMMVGPTIALLTSLPPALFAQIHITDFQRLTTAHGLSHNYVRCILQDSQGFLWFGTEDGLNTYDGYTFKIYKHDPRDSSSISDNNILCVYEDKSQRLWIGTANGLNQFDRYTGKFVQYLPDPNDPNSLITGYVCTIHEDRSGTLWIGTGFSFGQPGGLHKLVLIRPMRDEASNRPTTNFTRYLHDPNNPNSLRARSVVCILEDQAGALWLGTWESGLNKFDPQAEIFTRYTHDSKNTNSLSHNSVWSGFQDRSDILWFSTYGGGLNKFDSQSGRFTRYEHDPEDSNSINSNFVFGSYTDRSGSLWLQTDAGLCQFDYQAEKFSPIRFGSDGQDPLSSMPQSIYEDRSGVLWIGTTNSGIIRWDGRPKKFIHYLHDSDDRLSVKSDLRTLYEDKSGRLWILTHRSGVIRFDPATETFTHFKHDPRNPRSLSSNAVTLIGEDKFGAIWIGTWNAGLNRLDRDTDAVIRYQHDPLQSHSLSDNHIRWIYEDRFGTPWIGTGQGLNRLVPAIDDSSMSSLARRFDPQAVKFIHFKPYDDDPSNDLGPRNTVWAIHEDRFGNFWVSLRAGLNLFDRQTKQFTEIKTDAGVAFSEARYLHEDRSGSMWYAGGDGLWRFDYKTKHAAQFEVVPEVLPGSLYNDFNCLCEDQSGILWCGGAHGLHKFDPHTGKFIAHYYEQDGLPSNRIDKIVEDDEGRLWMLTGRGLSVFNERAAPGKRFRNFDISDGVDNSSISAGMLTPLRKSKRGDIYWGGANGLHRFYPKHLDNNPLPPPVVLTEFRLFNEVVKPDTAISGIKQIKLSYRENFFSFTFAALDYTNIQKNQFAYKLEGLDEDWIYSGNKHEANYTNVPPGEYTFRVKGSNNDGVWNEEGAAVKIVIRPPYWATWWFRGLAAVVIIGFVAWLYNYRVSKLLAIERTRDRIARDLHDELGSSLSSIALTAEMIEHEPALGDVARKQLQRIEGSAKGLMEALRDIVWSIDPDYDKLDDLLLYMKDVTHQLLGQGKIGYDLHFPQQVLVNKLSMEFRHNLFLTYKELLHNIRKHSGATYVHISLEKTDGQLVLTVRDNGKGFDPCHATHGNGLKSIQARSHEMHANLAIESAPGAGTKVKLTAKIP